MPGNDAVKVLNISKSFGGVHALKNVSLDVRKGEILALCGENGAGKSTLMKILSGSHPKDTGLIYVDGNLTEIRGPRHSKNLGISIIYQEFSLVPDLSVAENIFIDAIPTRAGFVRWDEIYSRAQTLLEQLGFDINPRLTVGELSVAKQQVVEIAKALSTNARILLLDEPTAVLAPRETERLFELLDHLKAQGLGIVYISHRLYEVFRLADRITVLRDGQVVGTVDSAETSTDEVVQMMIGRRLEAFFPERSAPLGEEVLRVENLRAGDRVQGVSFAVRAGEVLGVAGLVGSGRTELMRAIFGADQKDSGHVFLRGKPVGIDSPTAAVRMGMGFVPEDRKRQGVVLEHSVRVNVTLPNMSKLTRPLGFIDFRRDRSLVAELVKKLTIKVAHMDVPASTLSGGNQQKVALAKWFGAESRILIFDEPTRGVDVGAKVEIYKLINEAAELGAAVIFVSSELPEVIGMSDRVLVMNQGRAQGILSKPDISAENIMRLAIGVEGSA